MSLKGFLILGLFLVTCFSSPLPGPSELQKETSTLADYEPSQISEKTSEGDLKAQETFYPVGGAWWGVHPWGGYRPWHGHHWGGWGGYKPWHGPHWGGSWGGGTWGGHWGNNWRGR